MDENKQDKIRVIIADDHKLMREGTREFLSRHEDIDVVGEAANGEDAIALAKQLQPDVAIVDIGMPGVNGIEATHAIKANCPRTAVLILTMYDDDQYIFSLLSAGAAGYLLKDIGSYELVKAVRDVHAGEAVLHPTIARRVLGRVFSLSGKQKASLSEPLSDRELEILQLAAQGLSNREIGFKLSLSPRTVQAHLSHVFDKLGVASRTEATISALQLGVIRLDRLL